MTPKVYMDAGRRACISLEENQGGFLVAKMNADGIHVEQLHHAEIGSEWVESVYDPKMAIARYLSHAETKDANHPDAVRLLKSGLDRLEALAAENPFADLPLVDVPEAKTSTAVPPSAQEVAQVAHVAAKADDADSPGLPKDEVLVSEDTKSAVEIPVKNNFHEEVVRMSEVNQVNLSVNETPAATAISVAATPAASATAPEVASAPTKPTQAPSVANEDDAAYAVHVNGSSVTVEMGRARASRIEADAFAAREQIAVAPKQPMFYVGFDGNGVMARCVSISDVDRKTVGAMIGAWAADGFMVSTCTLKDLAKHVGAARKVHEPKAIKAESTVEPAVEPAV